MRTRDLAYRLVQPDGSVVFDFSRDGVLRSFEESLKRLGLDRVDVLLVHDPDDHEEQAIKEAFPALVELREQGVIGAIGAGMNQWQMENRFAQAVDVDCFLLAGRYTLLEQTALEFLDRCRQRQIGVFLGGVYNSGILAAGSRSNATYNYLPPPAEISERVRQIESKTLAKLRHLIRSQGLRGAIGYGGPCFPRDNVAFSALARALGARAELAEATDSLNDYQVDRVVSAVEARITGSGPIGVLGLSYKPDTAVIERSQGVSLVARLLERGHDVVAYDPKALADAQAAIGRPFTSAASAEACTPAMGAWMMGCRMPKSCCRVVMRGMVVAVRSTCRHSRGGGPDRCGGERLRRQARQVALQHL